MPYQSTHKLLKSVNNFNDVIKTKVLINFYIFKEKLRNLHRNSNKRLNFI